MNVCIIPARGGSKRIPHKNIRMFCGKPMIAWSIEVAIASECFDHIIVSTDSEEIAEISRAWGAEAPFIRPKRLADDYCTTRSVMQHAIRRTSELYGEYKMSCCLYATAPFVLKQDLINGQKMLEESNVEYVFSAARFSYPIQRAFRQKECGGLERLQEEHKNTRSQDLEEFFHDAGQFYWGRNHAFQESFDPVGVHTRVVLLPRIRVHDIDTEEDWDRAELIHKTLFNAE